MSTAERFDTIVIGAGQAGLATGYHLARLGIDFVLLDANEDIGAAWRKRWASLRLFTPARYSGLPGWGFPAPAWSWPGKDEVADYLAAYARRFDLPVRTGVHVDRLSRRGDGFVAAAGDLEFEADHVVVATGAYHHPRVPAFAAELDPGIVALHSSDYTDPTRLRDGGVLVVGAGNSGAEIAVEVAATHPTWLSGPDVGHLPIHTGSAWDRLLTPPVWLLASRVLSVGTPIGRKVRPKMLNEAGPLERVHPKDLAAAGVERVPRTVGVRGGAPVVEDGRVLDVSNVIWCTGFRPDLGWIDLPILDDDGQPAHDRGVVTSEPGLYLVGRGPSQMIDCVVVGAGPAGLATSAALTARDVEHVVLDAGRVGQTWRTQRWGSFRLNTPGWTTRLLGEQPRDAYLSGTEVIERLEQLAVAAPIREGVRVTGLAPAGAGYALRTSDAEIRARTVVVATGDENVPRMPEPADALHGRVAQLHTADYRTPAALPHGVVLVVGSGQSGCQISEDLLAGGRQVLLATSPVGRVPVRHRGHDTVELLHAAGFFDHTPAELPDAAMMRAHQPILAPGGRALSLQSLARAGVTLTGRLVAVGNGQAHFDDSAAANIAAGDAFATRIRAMLDELIARTGRPAPPPEPDEVDRPVQVNPPVVVELGQLGAVVWCTGFTGDFSWLDPVLLDDTGRPRHIGCAGARPGLWYVGLRWLTHRGSATLPGIPKDGNAVADALTAHLMAARTATRSAR